MPMDTVLWLFGVSGLTAIGGAFLVKALVKSGIEETVKFNFSKHLEVYKSELSKEMERLKTSLKNTETFFSLQFEALTKLRRIFRRILPKKRTPEMDWYEACEEIALSFSQHADDLDEYLCCYEAVLSTKVLKMLEEAISIATDGTFQFDWNSDEKVPEASSEAIKSAESLYRIVKSAVSELQAEVEEQVDLRRVH